MFDSAMETLDHKKKVRKYIDLFISELIYRGVTHDQSKLQEPEKSSYDKHTPMLRDLTYGSEEYRAVLRDMKDAIKHHYENNSHHPEHFSNGINGMTLVDILEMFCDWKAAGERHGDGNFKTSLEVNRKRFEMSDQLYEIFKNTAKELGWISNEQEE